MDIGTDRMAGTGEPGIPPRPAGAIELPYPSTEAGNIAVEPRGTLLASGIRFAAVGVSGRPWAVSGK